MSAADDASGWAETVADYGRKHELRYDPIGGLNPVDAPPALCPGARTGSPGSSPGTPGGRAATPRSTRRAGSSRRRCCHGAVLVKAHMPDLAAVVPIFNVESLEANPEDVFERVASRRKVEFESLDFNKRFLTTVPSDHDPIALRELFGPGFLDWVTTIDRVIDFGVSERQIYFLWRLRDRNAEELELALEAGGELFRRVRREMEESGHQPYPAGPWHAGLEPFPPNPGAGSGAA